MGDFISKLPPRVPPLVSPRPKKSSDLIYENLEQPMVSCTYVYVAMYISEI